MWNVDLTTLIPALVSLVTAATALVKLIGHINDPTAHQPATMVDSQVTAERPPAN